MRSKRLAVLLGLVMVLALMLSACAPPATPVSQAPAAEQPAAEQPAAEQPAAQAEPVTVTWAFWGSPEEAASHQIVADAFMQEHPEIKIEVWNQPWEDYFTKIQALWASGDAKTIPDVAFLWPTPKYASEGVLENLDSYIEASGYDLNDYWPGLLESAKYDGSVYGFPRDIEANVLYYNKDLFDAAGVSYPDDTWTWDDLQAAAEKLTVKDASGNTTQYALAMEGGVGKYSKWIMQNGGAILDDMRNPSKCMMDDPKTVEAVTFFADLINNGYAMRPADLSQAGGDSAVFASDQAAMIIQNTSRVSAFNAAGKNYDVAVVPIPAGGQRFNGAGGAAWVMSSGSDNKDAAWTFLQWLQSTDGGEKIYTERGEIFPALQSVANSPTFMTDQPPANKQGILDEAAASGIGSFGYFPEWDELDGSILQPAMDLIWAGEATPAEELPALCEQVNQFLTDNGFPK
ncbi:MAG: sugar ABC transporter substrate-binding protein [Anaerolineae bacterium]|nr:sugar ABC transporter substrate-binding protein [Anaerolineae bacterium]MCB9141211.1 sugar ABC transporter substrate-binding protein [Anaerolineales bacterium]MCO5246481.1 sugar ABC transporter substrate-binding protein [Anaerolineae bacterium]